MTTNAWPAFWAAASAAGSFGARAASRATLGGIARPLHRKRCREQPDLVRALAKPAAEHVAGVVPVAVPFPQPVVDDPGGDGVVVASRRFLSRADRELALQAPGRSERQHTARTRSRAPRHRQRGYALPRRRVPGVTGQGRRRAHDGRLSGKPASAAASMRSSTDTFRPQRVVSCSSITARRQFLRTLGSCRREAASPPSISETKSTASFHAGV